MADTCWGNIPNCWLAGYDIVIHLYIEEFKLCTGYKSQSLIKSFDFFVSYRVEICVLLVASLLNCND